MFQITFRRTFLEHVYLWIKEDREKKNKNEGKEERNERNTKEQNRKESNKVTENKNFVDIDLRRERKANK